MSLEVPLSLLAKPTSLTGESRKATLSTYSYRKLLGTSRSFLSRSPFNSGILLAMFLLTLPFYPSFPSQALESRARPASTFASIPFPEFRIEATLPSTVLADGTTLAKTTIIVNPIGGFTGTVTLSTLPLPADLACTPISPTTIPNSSGQATLSCSSNVAENYSLIILGVSGEIRHNATAIFTFMASTSPDFKIVAVNLVSLTSDTTATSNVTVTPQGGFDSEVNLTATVYPSTGLSVFLIPQRLGLGSGTATAWFNASAPGDYTVTISGMSKSLSHTITLVVSVTLVGPPDFEISVSSGSINLEAGHPSMTRIIVSPSTGFTSAVTLVVETPVAISCNLSPTSIQSAGTSTLTCNSMTAGEYTVTIKATSGTSLHTATVNLHVADISPGAPAPARILGLATAIFYGIIAGIIAVVFAGTVLVLRLRGCLFRRAYGEGYFFQVHIF
jgi:hypothetical protein